jgi:DNA topoisomerase-2
MQVDDDDDDDDEPVKKPTGPKKSATDQYQKLSHIDHILKRPDTYIGSVERNTESMWGMLTLHPNYHIANVLDSV